MNSIKDFIINYIERKGKLPTGVDVDTFNFVKTGYIDSLTIFKFIVDIEREYDIEFSDEDLALDEIKTIGGLADAMEKKVAVKKNG